MQSHEHATISRYLSRMLRRLLGPVARILVRHGMTHKDVALICKEAYVKAAADVEQGSAASVNVSHVALLTGMARRDVRKILAAKPDDRTSDVRQNNATRVLSGWHQDSDFLTSRGKPRVLRKSGVTGSFEALVRRYASDIPASTMAKELKRVKAIATNASGNLEVLTRYYMPARNRVLAPAAIERAGSVLEDVGETVDYNLRRTSRQPSRFERRATNPAIPRAAIPAFRQFVELEGQRFLESVDAWLSDHELNDETCDSDSRCRLGVGAYWIESDRTEEI